MEANRDAYDLIKNAKKILVVLGAGVSVGAGIPDFRSKNGVFDQIREKYKLSSPDEVFHLKTFKKDPKRFYDIFKEIWLTMKDAKPTQTHLFIQDLEKNGRLKRVYTQNIDDLEHKAGIENVMQVHGSVGSCVCTNKGCDNRVTLNDIYKDTTVNYVCEKCTSTLKPDIVFYGEQARFMKSLLNDSQDCDLLIIIGTSLSVYPIASVVDMVPHSVSIISINKDKIQSLDTMKTSRAIHLIGPCDDIVNGYKKWIM